MQAMAIRAVAAAADATTTTGAAGESTRAGMTTGGMTAVADATRTTAGTRPVGAPAPGAAAPAGPPTATRARTPKEKLKDWHVPRMD
jgi:hypothetical protein